MSPVKYLFSLVAALLLCTGTAAQLATDMQPVGRFAIDRTEVTIGQFQRFVQAIGMVTAAEKAGGGNTFEAGWEQRKGWTWRAPFGTPGAANEPVVHVTYEEARAFCAWCVG